MNQQPVGILLAAGNSQRFGSNKLLAPVLDDTPMLLLSAKKLVSVLPQSIVVINKALKSFQSDLEQLGFKVVINEQSEKGMGTSIACGVKHSETAAGWIIALADMPYIKKETITLLAGKLKQGANIVAPVYEQQRGHPVAFNSAYRDDLLTLNKDIGARSVIKLNKDKLELVETKDIGVIQDIDYPADLL
jgi:molybdenum cofactor cytidylyltransferase